MAENQENKQEFWPSQPVGNKDKETKLIEEIQKDKVQQKPLDTPPFLVFKTLDVNNKECAEEVYNFLYEYYVGADVGSTRFDYSIAQLKWWLNAKPNTISIVLRIKKDEILSEKHKELIKDFVDDQLVGFITGVPQDFSYNGKVMTSQQVDFFTIHPTFRKMHLAPLMIQEITRRSYKQGIYTAVFTAAFTATQEVPAIPKLLTGQYYHYLLQPVKLAECEFASFEGSARNMIAQNEIKVRSTLKNVLRPFNPKKDNKQCLDLLQNYLEKNFKSFPVFNETTFKRIMTPIENVIYSFVYEVDNQILAFCSFFFINNKVTDPNICHESFINAYTFYIAMSDDLEKHMSKEEFIKVILLQAKEKGADTFSVIDIGPFYNTDSLREIGFKPGSGSIGYHLFNINWGQEIQHKDIFIVLV